MAINDAPGVAVPPDALTPADVAGGVDIANPPGVPALLYTGEPGISFMAAALDEVAAALPGPHASEALPHGTAPGVGATRLAVKLDRTPVGSLDSS